MLCPHCGAESPERAAACIFCGEPFEPMETFGSEDADEPPPPAERKVVVRKAVASAPAAGRDADDERLARLIREAKKGYSQPAGRKPANRQEQEDDIFRELLASVFEINRRIKRQKTEIDRESLAALYTARSFSSPEAMGRTTAALRQLLEANRRIAGEMERALARIQSRVETAAWSRVDKIRFWRQIADGFAVKFKLRSEILEKQAAWTETSVDLYEFVLAHNEELSFEGRAVRSSVRETGEEFVCRLKLAKRSRDAFRAAASRNEEIQAGLLTEWGTADSRSR